MRNNTKKFYNKLVDGLAEELLDVYPSDVEIVCKSFGESFLLNDQGIGDYREWNLCLNADYNPKEVFLLTDMDKYVDFVTVTLPDVYNNYYFSNYQTSEKTLFAGDRFKKLNEKFNIIKNEEEKCY